MQKEEEKLVRQRQLIKKEGNSLTLTSVLTSISLSMFYR